MLVLCLQLILCVHRYTLFISEISYDTKISKSDFTYNFNKLNEKKNTIEYMYIITGAQGLKKANADPLKVYEYENIVVPAGWKTFSPRFYDSLSHIGVDYGYELFPGMVDDSSAVVVGSEIMANYLILYLKETHRLNCELILLEKLKGGVFMYYIRTIEDAGVKEN
ncbi:MAG: hypothetical protein P1U70_27965 [Saprospiraceae bacterium]|nr:hypothetical protein [Saprospiraceae bacterium]